MTTVNTLLSGGQGTTIPNGYVGYQVRGVTSAASPVSISNGVWTDIISGGITLGVGTWDINAIGGFASTSVTGTRCISAIGKVVGNSATGIIQGDNRIEVPFVPNSNGDVTISIAQYRVVVTSGTQTYYLKGFCAFSAGSINGYGRISAVLVG